MIPAPPTPVDDEVAGFRAFFDAVPQGQLLLDRQRRIRSANAAALRLFSPAGSALTGRSFSDLVDGGSGLALERAFAVASGEGVSPSVTVQGRTLEGTSLPMELTVLRLRAGRTEWFGAIVKDARRAPYAPGVPHSPSGAGAATTYTAAELLMANRLRELV